MPLPRQAHWLGIAGKSVVNLETPVGGYINNQAADAKAGVFRVNN